MKLTSAGFTFEQQRQYYTSFYNLGLQTNIHYPNEVQAVSGKNPWSTMEESMRRKLSSVLQ
jgi:hypothetical protein